MLKMLKVYRQTDSKTRDSTDIGWSKTLNAHWSFQLRWNQISINSVFKVKYHSYLFWLISMKWTTEVVSSHALIARCYTRSTFYSLIINPCTKDFLSSELSDRGLWNIMYICYLIMLYGSAVVKYMYLLH